MSAVPSLTAVMVANPLSSGETATFTTAVLEDLNVGAAL